MTDPDDWTTTDFRPAPPGWRLLYHPDGSTPGYITVDLPGWLVQRRGMHDRRVVAANVDPTGQLYPAGGGEVGPPTFEEAEHLWRVLGPSDSGPTIEEVAMDHAIRSRVR